MEAMMTKGLNWDVTFPHAELRPDKAPAAMPLRYRFSDDFLWGVAAAAAQIEGAWNEDGKGESIWDRFSHTPGRIKTGETGDVAADHYHRWKEDIELMKALHLSAYRLSLSWPRILPEGRGRVNAAGLDFYDRLIDELLQARITPFITLYHWDLPQALQDQGGWVNRQTCQAYAEYAQTVFDRLGDRVESWITFNEPFCTAFLGYGCGVHAPGQKNMADAFQVTHHLNVAHGMAVGLARELMPDAQIGTTLNVWKNHPADDSPEAVEAARIYNQLYTYWYLEPIFKGEYPPDIMRIIEQKGWAPKFEVDDSELISRKIDFLGLNYYWIDYITPRGNDPVIGTGKLDLHHLPKSEMGWPVVPEGLYETIEDINRYYGSIPIYITENGYAEADKPDDKQFVADDLRIGYLRDHLIQLNRAIASGFDVRGYFLWTLYDNFEWAEGYAKKLGIVRLVPQSLDRVAKKSALWYSAATRDGGFV